MFSISTSDEYGTYTLQSFKWGGCRLASLPLEDLHYLHRRCRSKLTAADSLAVSRYVYQLRMHKRKLALQRPQSTHAFPLAA
jgi:hypothetical protein